MIDYKTFSICRIKLLQHSISAKFVRNSFEFIAIPYITIWDKRTVLYLTGEVLINLKYVVEHIINVKLSDIYGTNFPSAFNVTSANMKVFLWNLRCSILHYCYFFHYGRFESKLHGGNPLNITCNFLENYYFLFECP